MIRYLFALLVFFAGFVATVLINGITILLYIDTPTFIFVGLIPFLFVSVLFGFKEMKAAYKTALQKEPDVDNISKSQGFFNVFGTAIWIMGMTGTVIMIIGMLANLDDSASIGPNLALALLSIQHSGILYLAAVLPFILLLKKKQKALTIKEDREVA